MKLVEAMAMTIAKGDLRQNPIEETGTDRMGALGRSDQLGAALWRVTDDLDHRALRRAAVLLARRVRRPRDSFPILLRLCHVVLREWLADKCRKCGGRGFLIHGEVVQTCTKCEGLAIRRHSDAERCRAMRFERRTYAKWESKFAAAHDAVALANYKVRRQASRQLERGRR